MYFISVAREAASTENEERFHGNSTCLLFSACRNQSISPGTLVFLPARMLLSLLIKYRARELEEMAAENNKDFSLLRMDRTSDFYYRDLLFPSCPTVFLHRVHSPFGCINSTGSALVRSEKRVRMARKTTKQSFQLPGEVSRRSPLEESRVLTSLRDVTLCIVTARV